MLFLLNDVVFDLDETSPVTPGDARRFEKLSLDYVLELGCEMFAEDPLLHQTDPQRARRLAWLIHDRSPDVNAALFAAPAAACPEGYEASMCSEPSHCVAGRIRATSDFATVTIETVNTIANRSAPAWSRQPLRPRITARTIIVR